MLEVIIEHAMEVLFALLAVIANIGAYKLLGLLKIDRDSKLAVKINEGIHHGLQFAEGRLIEKIDKQGFTLELKNEYVRTVADYLAESYPEAVRDLGLTGKHIAEMIEARLNERMGITRRPAITAN